MGAQNRQLRGDLVAEIQRDAAVAEARSRGGWLVPLMGEPMQTLAQAVHAAESSRHIFSDAERERERAEQSNEESGQPFHQGQGDNDGQSFESRPSGLRGGAGGPDELALMMEKLHVAKARPHSALFIVAVGFKR